MKTYKVEAVVLSRRNLAEADKLITIFTRQYGKKLVLAKGVRKITSRRAPYLEPFSHIFLVLHQGRTFDYVSEVTPIASYALIRDRLFRLSLGMIVLELVERLTAENQESQIIFRQLLNFINLLNSRDTNRLQVEQTIREFKKFLLIELGFIRQDSTNNRNFIDQKIAELIQTKLKSSQLLTKIDSQI